MIAHVDGGALSVEDKPPDDFEMHRLTPAANTNRLDVVRVSLVTHTEGPTPLGKTIHAAVITHPRGGSLLISSGGDSDVAPEDVAKAIDSLVTSIELR